MKTPIAFITIACTLLLISVCSLKAQVYNLNQAAGTISVINEEYIDDMTMEWNINAGQNSRITFTYIAEIEGGSSDYIYIYTVNSSGVPTLLSIIDEVGEEVYGTVTTTVYSGRAKVVFVSDYSNSYDCGYKGFKIQFYASNSYTTPEMVGYQGNSMLYPKVGVGTLEPLEALDVNGNIRANGRIYAANGYWGKLKTGSTEGYIELDPYSSACANIKTDRSTFLFNKPIYLQNAILNGANDLSLQTNSTARLTILSDNGNVGIGTSTPQEKLHVNGSIRGNSGNTGALRVQTTVGYIDIGPKVSSIANFDTDNYLFMFNKPIYTAMGIFSSSSSDLSLQTSGVTRIKALGSNGNVGIGVDNPAVKLHIGGSIRGNGTNGSLRVESNSGGYIDIGPRNTSGAHLYTNMGSFIFNKTIYSDTGFFGTLNDKNLVFKTNSDSTRMTILQSNGNVGIGVDNPEVKLHLGGSIRGHKTNGSLRVESNSGGYIDIGPQNAYDAHIYTDMGSFVFNQTIYSGTGVFGTLNDKNLVFKTNSDSTRMTILQSNGNVGIGTTSPDYKLDVAGVIRCSEVLVQGIDQIADFVFRPDYSLPSLEQVDEFISSNGHLPGIPSEAEVKEKGLGLVEMQIKLLQKVEELTLYVIEQEKRAIEQEKRALEQEKRIKELEAELMNK